MQLTIAERLQALSILPEKGGIVTLKLVQGLRDNLSLTPEEIEAWGVAQDDDGTIRWNEDANPVADLELTSPAVEPIRNTLRKLESSRELHIEQISLFEKFIDKRE